MGRGVVVTGEEWDTHWWSIFNDAQSQEPEGDVVDTPALIADRETAEQFGDRPQDTKETA